MRQYALLPALFVSAVLAAGCAAVPGPVTTRAQAPGDPEPARKAEPKKDEADKKDDDKKDGDKKDEPKGPPKTLFEWAVGPAPEKKDDKPEPIVTDRPDFTEASSTVGLGRVQLEGGYTYYRDRTGGSTRVTQTLPEALLRIGAFADWFELRFGQNYTHSRTTFGQPTEHRSGLDDMYVGAKVALAEAKGYLPELGIIFQATVPSGSHGLSSDQVLPGVNFLFNFEVAKDLLDVAGSVQANRAVDADRHGYVELAQSVTVGYTITSQLSAYTEWFAFYPTGATAPGTTAQHYVNGGFAYKVTPDFQLDIRAGWGLSKSADDFFAGAGFAIRY